MRRRGERRFDPGGGVRCAELERLEHRGLAPVRRAREQGDGNVFGRFQRFFHASRVCGNVDGNVVVVRDGNADVRASGGVDPRSRSRSRSQLPDPIRPSTRRAASTASRLDARSSAASAIASAAPNETGVRRPRLRLAAAERASARARANATRKCWRRRTRGARVEGAIETRRGESKRRRIFDSRHRRAIRGYRYLYASRTPFSSEAEPRAGTAGAIARAWARGRNRSSPPGRDDSNRLDSSL